MILKKICYIILCDIEWKTTSTFYIIWGDKMKEKVIELIGDNLSTLNVHVDDVIYEKEGRTNYLRVVIDADFIIDIDKVVEATKIIDPIVEKANLIEEEYILDVYAKSKGDE